MHVDEVVELLAIQGTVRHKLSRVRGEVSSGDQTRCKRKFAWPLFRNGAKPIVWHESRNLPELFNYRFHSIMVAEK